MKNHFLYLFVLLSASVFAQETTYQPFEVDSAAEPNGGVVFFNTFIQATLRKPISAQAAGNGGRVALEGIVEPDGRISTVKVLQKFRPDCDAEALRVFSLFNAWKPARKGGQVVRQRVTMSIPFPANPPFTYVNGSRITYFGADSKVTPDSTQAKYKQVAPIDENGIPAGDVVVYETKGKGWKESFRLRLIKQKNNVSKTYIVANQNYKQDWEGPFFKLNEAGTIIGQTTYRDGKPVGAELTYNENGAIAEKKEASDAGTAYMSWYPHGQIRQVRTVPKFNPDTPNQPEQVAGVWDRRGNQLVKDGNGLAVYETTTESKADTAKKTQFVEQGRYVDGFQQGVWTGRYADGSYFYEETYDKGICTGGKAVKAGGDTIRYNNLRTQPEFAGGMNGLGQFLAQNLRYPVEAQRAGVQGRVFVSFVVCTDGTLCDYEVIKSINKSVDEEAVRVVKAMSGRWKPGIQRGEKVRVKYNLPINFTLN
ncbi:TonB family protein [Spirosoma sp.]|uniref:TonB family protein n=1 Tax=Spirosoma sp. TaxID=1899569 RepID=UPI003B3B6B26